MNKRNFISSLLILVFFLFFYVYSSSSNTGASYWPKLICVVGMVFSALNAAIAGIQWRKQKNQGSAFPLSLPQFKRFSLLLCIAAAWIVFISYTGYLATSILATGVIVLVFEPVKDKRHIIRDVVVTLIFSFVIYQLFALLGVHFPKGLLL